MVLRAEAPASGPRARRLWHRRIRDAPDYRAEYGKGTPSYAELFRGLTYFLAGQRAKALRIVEEMEQRRKREYVSPAARGLIWVALGEKDRGYALLAKACAENDFRLRETKVTPLFDSLRAEPRFHEMLKCIHLE